MSVAKAAEVPCINTQQLQPWPQVAEAALTDLRVEGSLLVHADCVLGAMEDVPGAEALPRAPPPGDLHVHHLNGRTQVELGGRGLNWWSRVVVLLAWQRAEGDLSLFLGRKWCWE